MARVQSRFLGNHRNAYGQAFATLPGKNIKECIHLCSTNANVDVSVMGRGIDLKPRLVLSETFANLSSIASGRSIALQLTFASQRRHVISWKLARTGHHLVARTRDMVRF